MPIRREEFTTIAVDLRKDDTTIVLVPRDDIASAMLERILDEAPESLVVHSSGVESVNSRRINGAYLNFGGECYRRTEGNWSTADYAGAIKVRLDLSGVSYASVSRLRSLMWYGLRVDPTSTLENFQLVMTGICKVCENKLNELLEAEWSICDVCASVCDHDYTEGLGMANGSIARMTFCKVCGRAHPDWKPSEDQVKDALDTAHSKEIAVFYQQNGIGW